MYINLGKNKVYFMQDDGTDNIKICKMDFDGTNIVTKSEGMEINRQGYNSHRQYDPQINLLYALLISAYHRGRDITHSYSWNDSCSPMLTSEISFPVILLGRYLRASVVAGLSLMSVMSYSRDSSSHCSLKKDPAKGFSFVGYHDVVTSMLFLEEGIFFLYLSALIGFSRKSLYVSLIPSSSSVLYVHPRPAALDTSRSFLGVPFGLLGSHRISPS